MKSDGKEDQHHPTKVCVYCGKNITKAGYAKRQWKREQPMCRSCTEECYMNCSYQQHQTKICSQCNKECVKDQFPEKERESLDGVCRLCFEYSKKSNELTRQCQECKLVLPRMQFDIYQWRKGANASLCHGCRDQTTEKIRGSFGTRSTKELSDGIFVCERHSLERCDVCMMDFTLPNQFARNRTSLGRDLTNDEYEEISKAFMPNTSKKICIMDGQPMCPRSGRKLRCPCNEVTYCSKACQVHHWTIHKMTCKVQLEKAKQRAAKKADEEKKKLAAQPPKHV